MRDFYEANKGALKTAIIMILITIIILIITSFMDNNSKTKTPKEALEALAVLYYENEFYPSLDQMDLESKTSLLEKYSKSGLKISLRTFLENVTDINGEIFFNAKKKVNCDVDYTYVKIYSVYPYAKSDHKVEVTTDCEWNVATKVDNADKKTNLNGYETE